MYLSSRVVTNEIIKYLEQCLALRKDLVNVSFLKHWFHASKLGPVQSSQRPKDLCNVADNASELVRIMMSSLIS